MNGHEPLRYVAYGSGDLRFEILRHNGAPLLVFVARAGGRFLIRFACAPVKYA